MVALEDSVSVVSVVYSTELFQLQSVMKSLPMPAGSPLTVYPIIRETVVCAGRGLGEVNNP